MPQIAMEMLEGDFIGELVSLLRAEIAELDDNPGLSELLEASAGANVKAAVHFLVSDVDERDLAAPVIALEHAQAVARGDIELSALIRAYRIGHSRFLEAAMGRVTALGHADGSVTIVKIVNRAAQYIEKVCDQVEFAYVQERDRWRGSRNGLAWGWVTQLMNGSLVDIPMVERALNYRLDGHHLAVCIRVEDPASGLDGIHLSKFGDQASADLLEVARDRLAEHLGCASPPLSVATGGNEMWVWFSVPPELDLDVASVAGEIAAAKLNVRLALGSPASGLAGFRRTREQAHQVLRVASSAAKSAQPVIVYSQIASITLMSDDLVRLREFVVDVLGNLALATERAERLRETLRTFLMNGRSFAAAASRLLLHRNTIQYRVQQALDACGRSLDDSDETLNIQIALQACHWHGASVLATVEEQPDPAQRVTLLGESGG
ncbi:helix-turn-helix domain-containing protein [Rhodococcus erythropolis]|nr:helix-turn-helix domain-containing protein [Rhodococcus erythropolis]